MSNYLFIITLSLFILGLRLSTCRHLVPSITTPLGNLSAVRSACLPAASTASPPPRSARVPDGAGRVHLTFVLEWPVREIDDPPLISWRALFSPSIVCLNWPERERGLNLSSSRRKKIEKEREEELALFICLHEKVAITRLCPVTAGSSFYSTNLSSNRAVDNTWLITVTVLAILSISLHH